MEEIHNMKRERERERGGERERARDGHPPKYSP